MKDSIWKLSLRKLDKSREDSLEISGLQKLFEEELASQGQEKMWKKPKVLWNKHGEWRQMREQETSLVIVLYWR